MRPPLTLAVLLLLMLAPAEARGTGLGFDNWVFWFQHNREALDPPRSQSSAVRARVGSDVLPLLRWVQDRKNGSHQATTGNACIAIGKTARTKTHVGWLLEVVRAPGARDLITTERATLGLGLLRRSNPAERFDTATLDTVRKRLLEISADDRFHGRCRGVALVALGLLADQPTSMQAETIAGLVSILEPDAEGSWSNELRVGALLGLSIHPPAAVPAETVAELGRCVAGGQLYGGDSSRLVRSYATLALGRLGAPDARALLKTALTRRRGSDASINRSAAIALGELGCRTDHETRIDISGFLVETLERKRVKDATAIGLSLIAIGRMLACDPDAGGRAHLTRVADQGKYGERPYAALALGLAARAVAPDKETAATLMRGLESKKLDGRARSAFAVAAGLGGIDAAQPLLRRLVSDTDTLPVLRGYAALGLGLQDDRTSADLVANAFTDRRTEEMAIATLDAAGMLGSKGILDRCLAQITHGSGQAAVTLGRLQDPACLETLVALARSTREQDLTRSLAVAALGRLGDPEPRPSIGRVLGHLNYRATNDLVNELFGLL